MHSLSKYSQLDGENPHVNDTVSTKTYLGVSSVLRYVLCQRLPVSEEICAVPACVCITYIAPFKKYKK
jgi:hypothetical protein